MEQLEARITRLEKLQDGYFYKKSFSLGWMTWMFIIYSCWNFYTTFDINDTIAKFVNMFFFGTLLRDTFVISFQKKYFVKE